jgi:hypothetical protein
MDKNETKKTTVEETPGEKKTTEETHKPGITSKDEATKFIQTGKPAQDSKKTTVEKKG